MILLHRKHGEGGGVRFLDRGGFLSRVVIFNWDLIMCVSLSVGVDPEF